LNTPFVTVFVLLPLTRTKLKVPLAVLAVVEKLVRVTLPLPLPARPATPGLAVHVGVPPTVTKFELLLVGPISYVPGVRSPVFVPNFRIRNPNRLFLASIESTSRYGGLAVEYLAVTFGWFHVAPSMTALSVEPFPPPDVPPLEGLGFVVELEPPQAAAARMEAAIRIRIRTVLPFPH